MAAFDRRSFGDVTVTALSDGVIDAAPDIAGRAHADELRRVLRAHRWPQVQCVSVNAFALQWSGRTALVDTGAGDRLGPTLGRLVASLSEAAIAPSDIDAVLLTHMHPDHSNGLIDTSGNAVFCNAELVMHEAELAHWLDDARMAQARPRERRDNFEAARRAVVPYRDRIRTFRCGEVLPGVHALPLSGHTPGHTGYVIGSGSTSLLIWGDIVHLADVQAARPDITVALDCDRVAARGTREHIMALAADEQFTVAGMHLHFPGFARVKRNGRVFTLLPA